MSRLEADALRTIGQDLEANIRELERNITDDEGTLTVLEPLLQHLAARKTWHDSLGVPLGEVFFWSSPLLKDSGYESLKQLGLHLIASSNVRDQIVALYEGTYASLIDEQDHAQWVFWESVVFPLRNRELEYVAPAGDGPRAFRLRDYEEALDRGELLTALAQHRYFLRVGIEQRKDARTHTEDLLTNIASYLER